MGLGAECTASAGSWVEGLDTAAAAVVVVVTAGGADGIGGMGRGLGNWADRGRRLQQGAGVVA